MGQALRMNTSRACSNRSSLPVTSGRAWVWGCQSAMRSSSATAVCCLPRANWEAGHRSALICRARLENTMNDIRQTRPTLLYVDDEELACKYFARTVGAEYDVLVARSSDEASAI